MEKIRNLSIKKTIILYMAVSLLVSFLLSALVVRIAEGTQRRIWWNYVDSEAYFEAIQKEEENYETSIPRPSQGIMNRTDKGISELCDFLETYSVLFFTVAGSCIAVSLFYKNKLKSPLDELKEASRMIAEDELEFHVTYENQDELGVLCREFEKMRAQLEENNRKLWRMVEDEKALRAAIAHDIRSPLSVLKGYQEMLLEFVPEETLEKEKVIDMLKEGMKQIDRMDQFIETMREMTRLEERTLHYTDTEGVLLKEQIEKEAGMLERTFGKICMVDLDTSQKVFCIDKEVVLEVVENLLSNAFRYAKERIEVRMSSTKDDLIITVLDDGKGFRESSEKLTKAFYRSNPQDELQHFGMGMYISRVYCKRHGGRLLVGNAEEGGALVSAVFQFGKK